MTNQTFSPKTSPNEFQTANFAPMDFVTGGTGLVGAHVLFTLVSNGREVRALKRASSDLQAVKNVFAHYGDADHSLFDKIEWAEGDVTDIFSLLDALEGVTDVYHCAAMVSFEKRDAAKLAKINSEGTANLVNACLEKNIRKFGHVSSTSAVGKAAEVGDLTTEEHAWKTSKKNSNYSISKYNAEREVWRGTQEGLDVVIVNPCIVVGPCDWQKSSSHLFYSIYHGLKYYPTGSNGFVDVRDIAEALFQLMHSEIKQERFLLVGKNMSFKDYFALIAEKFGKKAPSRRANKFMTGLAWRMLSFRRFLTGKKPSITKESAQSAHDHIAWSTEKVERELGFKFRPIEEAVENATSYYQQHLN